jgi:hypothetical protein
MTKMRIGTRRRIALLLLPLCLLTLSGCMGTVVVRELFYRPSPSDPYRIWRAYVTDSGLLLLCGSVDNGRESMERVERVYNLTLRLEETLEPPESDEIQVVYINDDPSLEMIKGYLSDLCQFDKKRATKRPEESGWTKVMLDNWDEGYAVIDPADLEAGELPTPPAEPRVVMYEVVDADPPQYVLMGRLREDSPERRVLLILGPEHIEAMW